MDSVDRRLEKPKDAHHYHQHGDAADRVRSLPTSPPEQGTEQDRARSTPGLTPTTKPAQDSAAVRIASLEAPETIQSRHDRRARHGQQGAGDIKLRDGGDAGQEEEGKGAGDDAGANGDEGRQATNHGALQQGRDEAHQR